MTAKKQVRARLVFLTEWQGMKFLDVVETFNMTERKYLERDIDMQVENEDGLKFRIKKELIAFIREVQVVAQEVEVMETAVAEEE